MHQHWFLWARMVVTNTTFYHCSYRPLYTSLEPLSKLLFAFLQTKRDKHTTHRGSCTLPYLTQPPSWHQTLRENTPEKINSYHTLSKKLLQNVVYSLSKSNLKVDQRIFYGLKNSVLVIDSFKVWPILGWFF